MSIFRTKIDEITIGNIESFIAEKHLENVRLEYKREFSDKAANLQIAKEVSAFANQYGGVIIYGVEEEPSQTRRPGAIIGIDKSLNPRQKIQSVCIDHIYPPIVPEIQECEINGDNTKVAVVVRIDMSDEAPHTINDKTGFYIRSQDRSDPREMTAEEIELLWNRRAKVIERREWLLKRSYNRILCELPKRNHMLTPLILRAIPLYPLHPLTECTNLLKVYGESEVGGRQGLPLTGDEIKTSSDSIYTHIIGKDSEDPAFKREEYGELNIFGQVSYFENTMHEWQSAKGIILNWQLRHLLVMIKFLSRWYERLGFWGIIKFSLEVENLKGVRFYASYGNYGFMDEFQTTKLDNDIKVKREFSVSELIGDPEAITADIFKEYLWGCGLSVHNADMPVISWIESEKRAIGVMKCPTCKARDISVIDIVCKECKSKGA